jgi:hypothetical protein
VVGSVLIIERPENEAQLRLLFCLQIGSRHRFGSLVGRGKRYVIPLCADSGGSTCGRLQVRTGLLRSINQSDLCSLKRALSRSGVNAARKSGLTSR